VRDFVELTGIVIKSMPIGDFDRRVTIFTKERGKIYAFAKGARRINNQMMGFARIFAYGKFKLYEGRDSYNIVNADIANYFEEVSADIESTCYGTYFLEMLDYYTKEALVDIESLKLIYYTLLALTKKSIPNRLVRRIFELKLMTINGEYDLTPGLNDKTALYTWEYIIYSKPEKLFTFVITEEALTEIEKYMDIMIRKYIDRHFHSLDILEDIL
jgi:DNA repair protein recO